MSGRNPLFYQTRSELPMVEYGEGVWLVDQDGRRILDGCSGAVVANLGHAHPRILEAMRTQAAKVSFAYRTQFENEPAVGLARALVDHLSHGLERVFFVSGGSEAVETAIKLARSYHHARGDDQRFRIISRFPSYHGSTLGALSATGYRPLTDGYAPMMMQPNHVTASTCYHCPFGLEYPACGLACANDLERALHSLDPTTVAAFLLEPIGGASTGAIVPPDGYFERIHEIADRYGILVIYDEVMTGVGRTGAFCAYQHWAAARPDIIALSKGLGAGYTPLGAVACRDDIAETVLDAGSFPHGFSYAGNPLSCAIGREVLAVLDDDDLIAHARDLGAILGDKLSDLAQKHPMIGDVRGRGMLWGLEFVSDRDRREPFPFELGVAQRLTVAAAEEGLLIYPRRGAGGLAGDHALVAPPLTIRADELDELIARLDRALARCEADLADAA